MQLLRNLSVSRKLYFSFAGVSAVFSAALVATLLLGSSAQKEWHKAQAWNKAVAGIALQIEGSRQPLAGQLKVQLRIDELRDKDVKKAEGLESQAQLVGLVLAIFALIPAGLLAVIISRAISRPLGKIKNAAEVAAAGDLTVSVDIDS